MPTRLYFNSNISGSPVRPAPSGSWGATAGYGNLILAPWKDGVNPIIGRAVNIGAGAGSTALDCSCITPGLAGAQTISGRISGQLMVREYATTNNVNRAIINAKVVSNDGNTIRGVLLAQGIYGPTLEFVNNATHRNKTLISGTAVVNVTTINAQDGDRIVFEIGWSNSTAGTTPQAGARWGGGAYGSTNLPVNESTTTNLPGWIDFRDVDLKFRKTQFIDIWDEESDI